MVDLVLLHGPPASGKLTTARELSQLTGARVFHNHLTLDVAKSLLEFGEAGFWQLVHDLRILSFRSFFKHGAGVAITTWCYEEPEDYKQYEKMISIATAANGRILPVYLNCDVSSLESRISNPDRRELNKLSDPARLREIVATKNYRAVPDKLCINTDSSANTAESNAREIVREFDLKMFREFASKNE